MRKPLLLLWHLVQYRNLAGFASVLNRAQACTISHCGGAWLCALHSGAINLALTCMAQCDVPNGLCIQGCTPSPLFRQSAHIDMSCPAPGGQLTAATGSWQRPPPPGAYSCVVLVNVLPLDLSRHYWTPRANLEAQCRPASFDTAKYHVCTPPQLNLRSNER